MRGVFFDRDLPGLATAPPRLYLHGDLKVELPVGFTGTVSFTGIAAAATVSNVGLVFGLVFLLAGLCFKVSAVPFHMWTPDVYEGAPTPVTAFFASAPKVAALAVFTRVTLTAFPGIVCSGPSGSRQRCRVNATTPNRLATFSVSWPSRCTVRGAICST